MALEKAWKTRRGGFFLLLYGHSGLPHMLYVVIYILCSCVMVAAAVSFIIKTKEEEAPVLKKSAALRYETSDEDDDDDDDADGKDTVKFVALVSVADVGYV